MVEPSPIFRPESLEARRLAWLGRPIAYRSVPTTLMAAACLGVAGLLALLLAFGEYTRRIPVQGVLLPAEGLTRVVAPSSGWIAQQLKGEGDLVRRGEPIYVLGTDRTTALGNTQGEILDILHRKQSELQQELQRRTIIAAAEKVALQSQAHALRQEIAQASTQLSLNEDFASHLQSFMDKQQDFVARGITTSRDYESRLQAWMSQRIQIEALKRERIQLETKLSDAQNSLVSFDQRSESGLGELRRQILDLKTQISEGEARREVRVTAPRDGRVTSVLAQAGQVVAAGQALVTVLPSGANLEAHLLAPSRAIGFVREGDHVLLRYEAYPYQKFGQHSGTVSLIAKAPQRGDDADHSLPSVVDGDRGRSLYRITVKPDRPTVPVYGREEPLQVGMQVEAHLLVETRRLYQWVLDPLYSLRRSTDVAGASLGERFGSRSGSERFTDIAGVAVRPSSR